MSLSERDFVAASFQMETGLKPAKISKIGFCTYLVETTDGVVYKFK